VNQPLRVLLVQESEKDAVLLLNQLQNDGGYELAMQRVETATAFKEALNQQNWNIVIADYDSKQLGYLEILQLLRGNKLDLPVIIISSEIGAEAAANALKAGVNDVVIKANLARLKISIKRELREAELRRQMGKVQTEKQQIEAKYQALFDNAVVGIFQTTRDGHYISANPALAKIYGYESSADMLAHISDIERQIYVNPLRRREFIKQMQEFDSVSNFESQIYRKDNSIIWIVENARAVRDEWENLLYYEGFVEDVTARRQAESALKQAKQELEIRVEKRTAQLRQTNEQLQREIEERLAALRDRASAEAILAGHNQILELIVIGTPLQEVLDAIAKVIEELSGEMKCSFLLLDKEKSKLFHGAAPSLPDEYNQAMNGISLDSSACSCTTAAYQKETVIVEDISQDPLWAENRDFALRFDLRACWSMPILTKSGEVLGIFAMYYEKPRTPSDYDKQLIIKATHLAAIAIECDRTQSQLKKTQTQLQQLSANIPGVIYRCLLKADGSYSFPFISPGCYEIYELAAEDIQKDSNVLFEIAHECDRSSLLKSAAKSAETLQPWQWEGRIITPSGKLKWIKAAARLERQCNGDIFWDGVVMDITESKEIQEALEQSQTQLRQQTRELEEALHELQRMQMQLIQTEKMSSLGQLVAGIAHEINNPVNFIYNNLNFTCEYIHDILSLLDLYQQHYSNPVSEIQAKAETMELEFLREDLPKMLSSMRLGTDRICEIVLSLRNFSRVDQTTAQSVDIHQVIDSVVLILQHRFKPYAENPGIKIIKEYGELPLVKCYPGQLNQVFMNLIANAIDALEENYDKLSTLSSELDTPIQSSTLKTQNPPTIRVCTQVLEDDLEDNSRVLIKIADNGAGMALEHQDQIFQAFFTTKPIGKGTGLGLSISYQIVVEKHGGQLKCFSEAGKGTEFWIEIPIQPNI
jgi:PAS domain S-box-containing protein